MQLCCIFLFEAPDFVQSIQCTAISWQSVLVQWEPPMKTNGIITHYIITFGRNSTILSSDNETVHTFRDLLSNTSYQFKIKAATAAGEGREQICNASTFPESGNHYWNYNCSSCFQLFSCLFIFAIPSQAMIFFSQGFSVQIKNFVINDKKDKVM